MKKNSVYVDVHVLQTVPPSCVNRDDTGSPKTAVYGGVTRARVSSQAWKHAIREMFREEENAQLTGNRTKRIVSMIAKELALIDTTLNEEECEKQTISGLKKAGFDVKSAEKGTDALFFMSREQARAFAELVSQKCEEKKELQKALKENPSVDMVLFGRMVASDPSLNYDAVAQVAHSISTHAVHNEYDYFTAVDDCSEEDNAGAGHLGTVEFNSATLYRYATVCVSDLMRYTGEKTGEVTGKFVSAFIRSMPSGKQNTFANRTLPEVVYVTIRDDQPVNLAGAFEKAIRSEDGYVEASDKALYDYAKQLYENYAAEPSASYAVGKYITDISEEMSIPRITEAVQQWIEKNMAEM